MHPGEGFGVGLRPRDHVDAPCTLARGVLRNERRGVQGEVVAGEPAEVEPTAEFGPRLRFKLRLCVRCDHTSAIRISSKGPQDKHGNKSRLAHPVSSGGSELNSFVNSEKSIADSFHYVALPVHWAIGELREDGALLAPRERAEGKGIGVVSDRG